MKFSLRWIRCAPAVLLCVSLAGCMPAGQSDMEEEREPHFLEGKSCTSSMDYRRAIEKFEQTLEVNPHHSKAHLELGCLFEEKEPDPAAAIYHYECYLKLRPDAENAEFIRQRITNCKQDLAKTVLLPVTPGPGMQLQFDQLYEEKKRLQDEVERWKAYALQLQSLTNAAALNSAPPQVRPTAASNPETPPPAVEPRSAAGRPAGVARTHVVQAGDSFYAIARKYGIRLEALTAANPGAEPKRLRVGQTLNIPSP
jgi:tetratricopeptide (TPR) repeat protein